MPELVWYRSLYWRIAFGFVALLATLLVTQALVFLWLTGRMSELVPGRSPAELAHTMASDLARALPENPAQDFNDYLNGRYASNYRGWAVAFRDGRIITSRIVPPMGSVGNAAMRRLMGGERPPGSPPGSPSTQRFEGGGGGSRGRPDGRTEGRTDGRPDGRLDRGDRGPGDGFGRGGRGPGPPAPPLEFAPVVVNAETVAMVAVPVDPPPLWLAIQSIGPTLGAAAVGLLVAGAVGGAFVIFGPSRRRMRSLQEAARALGHGQAGARAIATGGDEVAMLARTFNDMAGNLEQRTQALVAADDSRRRLLADVSHELMTPLAAIRGYVETMTMPDVKLDDATRVRYLGIVADETERMEHIIGDLLDLARVEGGGGTWKREEVPVAALFERVLHRHDPLLRSKGVTLEATVAPDAAIVMGDPNRLEQVLQNLAANALRHTPEGGQVKLTASRLNGAVQISVEDSGPGIPPEHLPHVFDRFYKVDVSRTGTEVPSGSGLGLSIVQAIVSRHGGQIEAGNGPGGGAQFKVLLPDLAPG